MKSKRIITTVLAALMLSATLVGCSSGSSSTSSASGSDSSSSSGAATDKLDADQTLNVFGYDYTSLDPAVISDTPSSTSLVNTGEGLMKETVKDGKDVNVLAGADKMDVSADHLVYTFHIRDSKWSDGKAVRAQDYVYGWQRLANPKISQDYLGFLNEIGVKGATETGVEKPEDLGVKAVDDHTFQVTLAAPSAYFESTLNFSGLYPEREDIATALGDQYGVDYKKMVYNGAFTITDYAKGSKIVYTKNDNYWDAKDVKLKTVNGLIVEEPATYNKMFDSKENDMIPGMGDFIAPLSKKADAGEIQHAKGNLPTVFYYIFNTQTKALANPKVRQAMSLSYDRQTQINAVWKRNYPALGLVPNGIMVGTDDFRKVNPEPLTTLKDDPKALLAAGLKEEGISDPAQVKVKLLMKKADAPTKAQAEFFQNQMKTNLGITIDIVYSVDNPSYFKARTKGEFDICAGGWGADYNDVISFFNLFTSANGNNNGKFKNADYDKLIEQGKTELDAKKRMEMFGKAEDILIKQQAAVSPYFYQDYQWFQQSYVKGVYIPMFGSYYDFTKAYISGKQ